MRIVLDTNVLISGLLSPRRSPARIVRLGVEGILKVLYDDRILDEYREVLSRQRFPFSPEDITTVVGALEQKGELVVPLPLDIELPDPDDLCFLEVAATGAADFLVTGNARHYRPTRGAHRVTVVSPTELIRALAA